MQYSISVNEVKRKEGSLRGFATVVLGDSFKITNIAILENKEKNQYFVSMPRYLSGAKNGQDEPDYKDICHPITSEFRSELYDNILETFMDVKESGKQQGRIINESSEMPEFSVSVTPYEREGSNIRGLARIYFEDSFVINNVSILQAKGNLFIAMPSYKTNKTGKDGKPIYQDVCYPVTKEFREKMYSEILDEYEKVKTHGKEQAVNSINQGTKEKNPEHVKGYSCGSK